MKKRILLRKVTHFLWIEMIHKAPDDSVSSHLTSLPMVTLTSCTGVNKMHSRNIAWNLLQNHAFLLDRLKSGVILCKTFILSQSLLLLLPTQHNDSYLSIFPGMCLVFYRGLGGSFWVLCNVAEQQHLVLPTCCIDIFNFLVNALCNIYLNRRGHIWGVKVHSKAFVKLAGKVFCEISADLSDNFKGNFIMNFSVLYWLWHLSRFSILLEKKEKLVSTGLCWCWPAGYFSLCVDYLHKST